MSTSHEGKGHGGWPLSRRNFLASMGAGVVTASLPAQLGGATRQPSGLVHADDLTQVSLHINGREYRILVEPRWSLLYVLRERLGLTAAKEGCGRGECGACTVLVDGVPRYACLMLAPEAQGAEVTTLEGLMDGERLGPTQQAFADADAFQCGYCTSGVILAAEGLLRTNPDPSPEEVRTAVSGNVCRCGAYPNIFRAVSSAAASRGSAGGPS